MMEDPIVEETRKARQQLDSEFDGDLEALFKYLLEIERENASRVVKLPAKPPTAVHRKVS